MADNVVLNAGVGGDTVAADDVGGVKYQVVKVAVGADGAASLVSNSNPVPVSDAGSTLSIDDGAGSITVDGTVELGATTLAALESITVVDGGGSLTVDGTVAATQSGTWNIGSITTLPTLAAVTTVSTVTNVATIGTSVTPGTSAAHLGKAEDAPHASGDTGVMMLGVRRDADTTLVDATGDYAPFQLNAAGSLKVAITSGAGSGGTSIADGASFTRDTTSVTLAAAAVETSAPTLTNGDAAALSMTTGGALRVALASGSVAGVIEDAASAGGEEGVLMMGVRQDTLSSTTSTDGDYCYPKFNSSGALYVAGSFSASSGAVSTANSSTANLAGAAVFTGTSEETTNYAAIQVSVFSSHASGTNGLSLQQSSDATNWDITDVFTVAAATALVIQIPTQARYYRLVYTNGATLTTSLRIQTLFKTSAPRGSAQRPADATSNENDFEQNLAFGMGYNGATWDRLRSDTTNGLDVDVTRVTGTVTIGGVAATDAAVSGNPVYVAGRGSNTTPTAMSAQNDVTPLWLTLNGAVVISGDSLDDAAFTPGTNRVTAVGYLADDTATDSVDEGDAGAARMTLNRKQISQPYESEANTWSYAAAAGGLVNTTGVTAKAAAGAGLRNYVTSIQVTNSHQTTGTEVVVRDGAAGTVIHRGWAPPNAGYAATFPVALRGTANTLLEIAEVTTTATAGVLVNLQGYIGA